MNTNFPADTEERPVPESPEAHQAEEAALDASRYFIQQTSRDPETGELTTGKKGEE